jgi:hypothetical protein
MHLLVVVKKVGVQDVLAMGELATNGQGISPDGLGDAPGLDLPSPGLAEVVHYQAFWPEAL